MGVVVCGWVGGWGGGGMKWGGEGDAAHRVVEGELLMSHVDNCLLGLCGRRRGARK